MENKTENLDKAFEVSEGRPIVYKGSLISRVYAIPVEQSFQVNIEVIAVNSEWKQGIRLKADLLTVNNQTSEDMIIWSDDVEDEIELLGKSIHGSLLVWNAWDSGNGAVDSWHNGAAMMVRQEDNKYKFYCNDGHPDDDFNDLVFEITVKEGNKNGRPG